MTLYVYNDPQSYGTLMNGVVTVNGADAAALGMLDPLEAASSTSITAMHTLVVFIITDCFPVVRFEENNLAAMFTIVMILKGMDLFVRLCCSQLN